MYQEVHQIKYSSTLSHTKQTFHRDMKEKSLRTTELEDTLSLLPSNIGHKPLSRKSKFEIDPETKLSRKLFFTSKHQNGV